MPDLTLSIKNFTSLNRAPGATWIDATKRRVPHKLLLLLAVLDLVHRGVINLPFIAFSFSRLEREPFWDMVPQPDTAYDH